MAKKKIYKVHKHLINGICFARSGRVVLKEATQTQLAKLAKENPYYVYDPENPDGDSGSIMSVEEFEVESKTKKKSRSRTKRKSSE